MKVYSKRRIKAQSIIEFSIAFVGVLLLLFLTCNLFVWLGRNIVQRQRAYEGSRAVAGTFYHPGEFSYTPEKLDVFAPGGGK